MKTMKAVSPYLKRPLRSLQEVVQTLGDQGAESRSAYGTSDAAPPPAENNNTPAAIRTVNRPGVKSA